MTALAQCLADAQKKISGSDVAEDFVTKIQLDRLDVSIESGFDPKSISDADCVIFTAAHGGPDNPQVIAAQKQQIPTFSHAEALGMLFNQKQGVAVCGVGGKSTTSAMIAWILEKTGWHDQTSFAVGVGNIPGLEKTGQWTGTEGFFIAEADEYVTDPKATEKGKEIQPRFSFLNPYITICTNLKFDHPDVYRDFNHTKEMYRSFFSKIEDSGFLVYNSDDQNLSELASEVLSNKNLTRLSFGKSDEADFHLREFTVQPGETSSTFTYENQNYQLKLSIPGKYNVMNALAAVATTAQLGVEITQACISLESFSSTMRRSEFIGIKNDVRYYDDYAHHPNEVKQVITAFNEWFPQQRVVIAFQSHTFSRTKQLFDDFVDALSLADQIVMTDIFASARENHDTSVSSQMLCQAINEKNGMSKAQNLGDLQRLASFLSSLPSETVVVTVGAGDIYKVHDLIK